MAKTALLKQVVDEFISPQLKAAGFQNRGQTWNRDLGEIVHVIDVQESRWSSADKSRFTLNIGVMLRQIEWILWGTDSRGFVSESSCFPRFRIGYLPGVDAGYDSWWELRNKLDIDDVGPEVERLIGERCIPLLDRCRTNSAVLEIAGDADEWKHPAERLAFAILLCLRGRKEDGEDLLGELNADGKLKAWHARLREVQDRLSKCSFEHP